MKRRSISFSARLYALLEQRSRDTGRSISALAEEAMGAYLGVDTRGIRLIKDLKQQWRMK